MCAFLVFQKAKTEHETGMLEYLEDIIGSNRYSHIYVYVSMPYLAFQNLSARENKHEYVYAVVDSYIWNGSHVYTKHRAYAHIAPMCLTCILDTLGPGPEHQNTDNIYIKWCKTSQMPNTRNAEQVLAFQHIR